MPRLMHTHATYRPGRTNSLARGHTVAKPPPFFFGNRWWHNSPIIEDKNHVLGRVLELARRLAPHALVVFDVDSTLLDNRPRQAQIFREFGELHGVSELSQA